MAESKENHYVEMEKELKSNINILLSKDTESRSHESDESLQDSITKFEDSVRKMQSFFTRAMIVNNHLNPQKKDEDEIKAMRSELTRKDALIKEQLKKLSRYRMEIEVIQEAQMQARAKTL